MVPRERCLPLIEVLCITLAEIGVLCPLGGVEDELADGPGFSQPVVPEDRAVAGEIFLAGPELGRVEDWGIPGDLVVNPFLFIQIVWIIKR